MPIRTKNAKLFLDFTWQHVRCKEYTGLADTPENRRRCEKKMAAVDKDIANGTFDYRRHFPDGARLQVFHPEARPTGSMGFQAYAIRWHKMRSPFRTDGTLARDAALHPSTWLHDEHTIRKHFLPAFGPLALDEIDVTRVNEFRRSLVDAGLAGKTVTTIMGLLHKAFADALEENLIDSNPVLRIASRRQIRLHQRRSTSDPLLPAEVAQFLAALPGWYRDFYNVWFRLGWRPSEIVAVRLGWLDFDADAFPAGVGSKRHRRPGRVKWTALMIRKSSAPSAGCAIERPPPGRTTLSSPIRTAIRSRKSGCTNASGNRRSNAPDSGSAASTTSATRSSPSRSRPARTPAGWRRCAAPPSR